MSEQRIDENRLAEIEARVNAATPGPWRHAPSLEHPGLVRGGLDGGISTLRLDVWTWHGGKQTDSDAALIAESRTDIPDLIADLRAAREEIERLKGEADRRVAEEREAIIRLGEVVEVVNGRLGLAVSAAAVAAFVDDIRARGAK